MNASAALRSLKSYAWMPYAVSAEKYTASSADMPETIRLLRMPESTGRLASLSTFLRFVSSDLPGRKEKPRWISKWECVALIAST